MTTPDFITRLRKKIGNDPLWLTGITAYVEDDAGRILLGRRADTGQWALVYGIVEPAEEPADTCVREVREETGVDVTPTCLVSVKSSPYMVTYANGDQCQYMDLLFACHVREGGNAQPRVADDESLEVGWFEPTALPQPLATSTQARLELVRTFKQNAAAGNPACLFTCTQA